MSTEQILERLMREYGDSVFRMLNNLGLIEPSVRHG